MRSLTRVFSYAAVAAVAISSLVARAQPAEPWPSDGNPRPGAAPSGAPIAPALDEGRIRELVDREVARILTERSAKEAAERVARDAADRDSSAGEDSGEIKGASGFMDTRLAFTLTNENVLVKPGDTSPSVPGWRFGTPSSLGVLFFDNYDTRYSGFETLSHATMYRAYTSGHLQAEAAFVIRIDALDQTHVALSDDGSYLTLSSWRDPSHKDPTRISLTAFPVSADRFRLGYSYRLSWGGNPEYQRARSSVPGLKLQYDGARSYAFIGAKSALVVDPKDGRERSAPAVLAGAGVDPHPMIRLEINGGYFDRGYNELPDVQRRKVRMAGASVQAQVHHGMPLGSSLDYQLYKFHGESVSDLFAPETYPGGLAWLAQSEFTVLGQTLKDPAHTGATVRQYGMAGDLNVRVKLDRYRFRLDLSYRDLAFILHSQPGLPAYEGFPKTYTTSADYFAALGIDRNWGDWLTLGLIGGVERPAALTSTSQDGIPGTAATMGPATAVIRSNNIDTRLTVLPAGQSEARSQPAIKGTARVDFARVFSAVLELFYSYDHNQTRDPQICSDVQPCPLPAEFGSFHQLGLNATLQARF